MTTDTQREQILAGIRASCQQPWTPPASATHRPRPEAMYSLADVVDRVVRPSIERMYGPGSAAGYQLSAIAALTFERIGRHWVQTALPGEFWDVVRSHRVREVAA